MSFTAGEPRYSCRDKSESPSSRSVSTLCATFSFPFPQSCSLFGRRRRSGTCASPAESAFNFTSALCKRNDPRVASPLSKFHTNTKKRERGSRFAHRGLLNHPPVRTAGRKVGFIRPDKIAICAIAARRLHSFPDSNDGEGGRTFLLALSSSFLPSFPARRAR